MIRKAVKDDLNAVEQSYIELLTHEKEHGGTSNWMLGVYPTRETAARACENDTLYVLQEDDEICASVILNQNQAEVYGQILWEFAAEAEEVLVIHTLCIPPAKAGRGYGKRMVQFAVEAAREKGCKVIRLDTFAGNDPAAALYQKLGFRYAGKVATLHEGVIPEELIFFEKEV